MVHDGEVYVLVHYHSNPKFIRHIFHPNSPDLIYNQHKSLIYSFCSILFEEVLVCKSVVCVFKSIIETN